MRLIVQAERVTSADRGHGRVCDFVCALREERRDLPVQSRSRQTRTVKVLAQAATTRPPAPDRGTGRPECVLR